MHFYFLIQSDAFAKSIDFAWWPFLDISKCSHFSNISCFLGLFFGAVFCIEQLQCFVETFLAFFYEFLIVVPK